MDQAFALLFGSLWYFLPAAVANMAASLLRWIPLFDRPLDGGRTFRGRRIFGAHKTWRGLILGTGAAVGFAHLQALLEPSMTEWIVLSYQQTDPTVLGVLLGFGALIGDAGESFLKRQRGIPPGQPWLPWDQTDWIIGGLLLVSCYVILPWYAYPAILLSYGALHPLANGFAYLVGWQSNKL